MVLVMMPSIMWAVCHTDPFHIGIILGTVYGYLSVRVRKLTLLIMEHIIFDIVGFASIHPHDFSAIERLH